MKIFKKIKQVFKSIYNPRITTTGRTGVIYNENKTKYFIDSETLISPSYDIVIWAGSVRFHDSVQKNVVIQDEEKQKIAERIKNELESMGMKVELIW